MKIREILEEVFLTKDEMFNDEHIRPRIAQAEQEIRGMIPKFNEEKFDREALKSDHFCPECHKWYKKQIINVISDITEKLFGEGK